MKTFTLRLTDLEADALERLAYVNGKSKNKMITSMIVNEYGNIDAETLVLEDEIIGLTLDENFWHGAYTTLLNKATEENALTDADIAKALRAVEYVIERTEDPETIEKLAGAKADIISEFVM